MYLIRIISVLAYFIFAIGCGQINTKYKKDVSSFDKIIFHTTGCYGKCPTYHLEVDSEKNLRLYIETLYKNEELLNFEADTARIGYYIGKADNKSFAFLNNELKTIGLDSLEFNSSIGIDGSMKTIIVYYDGKRKVLKSQIPPKAADKLIKLLYSLCETNSLTKTTKAFEIEDDNDNELSFYKSLIDSTSFDRYNVPKMYLGPISPPDLSTFADLPKDTQENILHQYNKEKQPNFASHYLIVSWSCGSPCQMNAIFDVQTGKVVSIINTSVGLIYKPDSYLILKNPPRNAAYDKSYREIIGEPQFCIFKDSKITEIPNPEKGK